MATSVGSRSMLEAPKNPAKPVGPVEDVARVLGLGERAAVAEDDDLRVDLVRGVGIAWTRAAASSSAMAVWAPIAPLRRQAHVRRRAMSAPAIAIARASSSLKT